MATSAPYPDRDVRKVGELQELLPAWLEAVSRRNLLDQAHQEVFAAIDSALRQTSAYMRRRRETGVEDPAHEERLSRLWMAASYQASTIAEPRLARALRLKGLGWTDPQWWERAEQDNIHIRVEDIEQFLTDLDSKRAEAAEAELAAKSGRLPDWFSVAGLIFTAITILFLMYYVMFGPPPDPSKKTAFNFLMALCAAASFAFIGGSLITKGQIPGLRGGSPIAYSASGGIGVLLLVFILLQTAT